jgi:hypothetical protein
MVFPRILPQAERPTRLPPRIPTERELAFCWGKGGERQWERRVSVGDKPANWLATNPPTLHIYRDYNIDIIIKFLKNKNQPQGWCKQKLIWLYNPARAGMPNLPSCREEKSPR